MSQATRRRNSRRNSSYSSDHPLITDVDPMASLLYQPRSITVLVVGLVLLAYFSDAFGFYQNEYTWEQRAKQGAWAFAGTFLGYSALYAPHTFMIRPHPIVWKLVHGVGLLYMLFLVVILFMDPMQARTSLKYWYADLGVELDERAYGADCRIHTPEHPESQFANIRDTVLDEFVLAHLLGWVAKTMVFRDWKICLFLSIGFELMELTFHHMLPNFNECWWDSWILDVLLCNNIGIMIGLAIMKRRSKYGNKWVGVSSQPTLLLKAKRLFLQFTPESVEVYEWNMLSNPKRFMQCLTLAGFCLACEVNAFFMKFVLWVPPRNMLNTYRLIIFFTMVVPAVNEYYYFVTGKEVAVGGRGIRKR
jgi:phosphatidylserine synthase 2